MALPFGFTHKRDATSDTAEILLRLSGTPSTEDLAGWADILRTFVNGARCGAMSGPGIAPSSSGCVVREFALEGCEAQVHLTGVALDPCATTILVNLCQWGHAHISEVAHLTLQWGAVSGSRDSLPGRWPHLSFELREYELLGQLIVLDIEFIDPQSAEVRETVNQSIGQWFKVSNWGGYASSHFLPPQSTVVISSTPMTTEPRGICWYFDEYLCADGAFDGLLNCLQNVHQRRAAIRRVTIGE